MAPTEGLFIADLLGVEGVVGLSLGHRIVLTWVDPATCGQHRRRMTDGQTVAAHASGATIEFAGVARNDLISIMSMWFI
ncbi:MAG TPA: hypothetical protein VFE65_28930 [Pseudonocardia sp.]|nr:hypothetical protein [Pseudonocardia sp.]